MKLLLPKVIVDCERMKYPFTGLYEYCKNLCNALVLEAENGQQLSFYVRESEFGFLGEGFQYVKQKSLHKFVLPPTKKFDVWHATYQGTMYFPYSRKIKVVLTVHDINFMHEADRSVSKKQKELKKLQDKIDRSDFIVAISHFVLDDLKKNLNLEGKRTVVIYNGCTIDQNWTPTQDSKFVQYDYEYIFTIGTIIDKKNFHVIPTLLVGNELHLIIAGIVQSQAYYAEIILEAKKNGVEDRIHFIGTISDEVKNWHYQNCKAFIFTSLMEGFGLPVIEAMHFGKPVFLSKCTSLPEIGGEQAYYFESFNPVSMQEDFKKGMEDYQENPIEKSLLIRERAAMFSWKHAAIKYLEVYQSLIDSY